MSDLIGWARAATGWKVIDSTHSKNYPAALAFMTMRQAHVNVCVENPTQSVNVCFSEADMMALRDALIELYPLPVKPAEPKVSYFYEKVNGIPAVHEATVSVLKQRTKLGEFRTYEDAQFFLAAKKRAADAV
jgi:hypothetical protein